MSSDTNAKIQLPWTGERYVPEVEGEIELEHIHRYAIARELAYGKDVLDIACGEGYGSELLATVARKVTGVDISEEAIAHASHKYTRPNISFTVGSCADIPLADASVDIVVSFETIEHHDQHLEMMNEIRRVLRPDGVLIISSPDKHEYSDVPGFKNEYHVKELYLNEFSDLLSSQFSHVSVFGQRVYFGSLVAPVDGRATRFATYSRRNESVRREPGIMRPVYYIALASNAVLPEIQSGLYDGTSFLNLQIAGRDGQIASFNQAVVERDGQIAGLNQALVERDGQIASLNQALVERDGRVADLNQAVVERDGQIASLNQAVVERDGQIAGLNQALVERDGQIASLNQALVERDGRVADLNQAVVERDGQIASLNQAVVERDGQIASLNQAVVERDGQIASLNQAVVERDGQIASLNQALLERDGRIVSLTQPVAERDGQIASLNQAVLDRDGQISDILNSTTWRLTWPARFVIHQVKRAMYVWRLVPKVTAYSGSVRSACVAAIHVYRREGIAGVRLRLKGLPLAPNSANQLSSATARSCDPIPGISNFDKEEVRKDAEAELGDFLASGRTIDVPQADSPRVSIVLVLYNQAGLTLRCLRSIAAEAEAEADSVEVIAVDNASADATQQLVERFRGLRYERNDENIGFLKAVNQAAAMARGDYLLLLNNDAELLSGTLRAAVQRIESDRNIGAVGGKIILLDGTLQEAGSIIWGDGSCEGYGRGADPEGAEYRFLRDVDYCSGAFLLIRAELFRKLGGFDEAYAPAYYEEVDFCCRLWQEGFRIVYDPKVVIRHFEFASSRRKGAALAMQIRNRAVFCVRQAEFLAGQLDPFSRDLLLARSRSPETARVLLIEDRVPHPSLGSGYPRSMEIVREIAASGRFVTFYPLIDAEDEWDEVYRTLPESVEVMLGWGKRRLKDFLKHRDGYYDLVLVCRPHNMAAVVDLMGEMRGLLFGVPLLYDAEALYAARQIQAAIVKGRPYSETEAQRMLEQELALAAEADRVLAVSVAEATQFSVGGCSDVRVLGHSLTARPTGSSFAERAGFLFVGRLWEDESPNVDSVEWFIEQVWPSIWRVLGRDVQLTLVGHINSQRILNLRSASVRIVGRAAALGPYFETARVFIVPTRYAAGIPLKALESGALGLPMVATPLVARQLGWRNEEELLVAEGAEAFSEACIRLHSDEALWVRLRSLGLARIAVDCSPEAFRSALLEALKFPVTTPHLPNTPASQSLCGVQVVQTSSRRVDLVGAFDAGSTSRSTESTLVPPADLRRCSQLNFEGSAVKDDPTLLLAGQNGNDYDEWVRRYDTVSEETRARMRNRLDGFAHKPLVSIVMLCYKPNPAGLRRTIESVRHQNYPYWELCIAADAACDPTIRFIIEQQARRDVRVKVTVRTANLDVSAAFNSAIALAGGEYIALLDQDDSLAEHALFSVVESIQVHRNAGLFYSDEDKVEESGRRFDPYFKCDWNYDLLLSSNMIGHLAVYKAALVRMLGGFRRGFEWAQEWDLVLRCIERLHPDQIIHIPRVLYHRRAFPTSAAMIGQGAKGSYPHTDNGVRALNEHLERKGVSGKAESVTALGAYRVRYALPNIPPRVTLIIPTRNGLNLLRTCVFSILEKTDYPNYEILIVDNASDDAEVLEWFDSLRDSSCIRILRDDRPFNFSALNNRAVQAVQSEFVGLINNDVEVIGREWLSEMISIALQPGVGAVGARLWYPDDTLQHGGVILNPHGIAGHSHIAMHSHKHFPRGRAGYFCRAMVQQSFTAVTAACLVIRRSTFLQVGGLDEEHFKITFNDVDFCLRVRQAGYRNVWTPYAELYHHESATRGYDANPEERARAISEAQYLAGRLLKLFASDPAYSPNLTVCREDFSLAWPPRVQQF